MSRVTIPTLLSEVENIMNSLASVQLSGHSPTWMNALGTFKAICKAQKDTLSNSCMRTYLQETTVVTWWQCIYQAHVSFTVSLGNLGTGSTDDKQKCTDISHRIDRLRQTKEEIMRMLNPKTPQSQNWLKSTERPKFLAKFGTVASVCPTETLRSMRAFLPTRRSMVQEDRRDV
jgi:hypothetical protein